MNACRSARVEGKGSSPPSKLVGARFATEWSTVLQILTVGALIRACRAGLCWARYFLFRADRGVPGPVSLVLRNRFLVANQVRGELIALGQILASQPPECALEIGTAEGALYSSSPSSPAHRPPL
jgi:hypothetical protein